MKKKIKELDIEDSIELQKASTEIQELITAAEIPQDLADEIILAYDGLNKKIGIEDSEVAVRSSATAEDLPEASFAGQQDTYLHIRGDNELLNHIRKCWASLWTSRAIYYREIQGFDHFEVSISVVIQKKW